MTKRVYLDAGILIAAWRGAGEVGLIALEMLDATDTEHVVSDAVWLEVFPKPLHQNRQDEVAFYQAIFDQAVHLPWSLDVLHLAQALARQYGIAAMDAIHAAFAIQHDVDELLTAERPEKPLFRLESTKVRSLRALVGQARA